MKAADYIAHSLSHKGVTDVFGVPGGVILELIYAFDRTQSISLICAIMNSRQDLPHAVMLSLVAPWE